MTIPLSREFAAQASAQVPREGGSCQLCRGRLRVVARIELQADGQPTTYYACEGCGQVLVRKS